MTRLPTTCECKTFNLKMLNTTIYKIAIINAHSVFYSCQVLWQKKCLALLEEDKELEPKDRDKLKAEFTARLKSYQKQEPY